MEDFIPIVGILISGASIVLIVWMVADYLRRKQQARLAADFTASCSIASGRRRISRIS